MSLQEVFTYLANGPYPVSPVTVAQSKRALTPSAAVIIPMSRMLVMVEGGATAANV